MLIQLTSSVFGPLKFNLIVKWQKKCQLKSGPRLTILLCLPKNDFFYWFFIGKITVLTVWTLACVNIHIKHSPCENYKPKLQYYIC